MDYGSSPSLISTMEEVADYPLMGSAQVLPPSLVSLSPMPTPSSRRLSSQYLTASQPVPSSRRMSCVSLQGRLVNAQEASSAKAIGGNLSREEAIGWELFSPVQRFLIVAVIGVAVSESKKNRIISQLKKSVELRDEVYIRGRKRDGLISDMEISGLRIGLVFQSAALFDSLTVRENVGFLLYENSSMTEEQISELVAETLAAVGLKGVEDRLPSELSGGMKKRVALARSIIFDNTTETVEPEVLLYDEPTAGIDRIASTVVEDLIRSVHLKEGEDAIGKPGKIASYVVVTHQHSTVSRAVDRLLFLHEGKVVWQGMTHEFTTSTDPIVQQVVQDAVRFDE